MSDAELRSFVGLNSLQGYETIVHPETEESLRQLAELVDSSAEEEEDDLEATATRPVIHATLVHPSVVAERVVRAEELDVAFAQADELSVKLALAQADSTVRRVALFGAQTLLANADSQLDELEDELEEKEDLLEVANDEVDTMYQKVEAQNEQLAMADEDLAMMKDDLSFAKGDVAELARESDAQWQELDRLHGENGDLKALNCDLQAKNDDLLAQLTAAQELILTLTKPVDGKDSSATAQADTAVSEETPAVIAEPTVDKPTVKPTGVKKGAKSKAMSRPITDKENSAVGNEENGAGPTRRSTRLSAR